MPGTIATGVLGTREPLGEAPSDSDGVGSRVQEQLRARVETEALRTPRLLFPPPH